MKRNKENIKAGDFLFPTTNLDYGIRCVYKLHFPDDYFYIGRTQCLKNRLFGHKSYITKDSIKYGYKTKLLNAELQCIEIIAMCTNDLDASEIETNEIKKYWGQEKLVNADKPQVKPFPIDRIHMDRLWATNPDLATSIERLFKVNPLAYWDSLIFDGKRQVCNTYCQQIPIRVLVYRGPSIIYREDAKKADKNWSRFQDYKDINIDLEKKMEVIKIIRTEDRIANKNLL